MSEDDLVLAILAVALTLTGVAIGVYKGGGSAFVRANPRAVIAGTAGVIIVVPAAVLLQSRLGDVVSLVVLLFGALATFLYFQRAATRSQDAGTASRIRLLAWAAIVGQLAMAVALVLVLMNDSR
jgi:hypothetical protein